jgi:AraC family transcriptional regulator
MREQQKTADGELVAAGSSERLASVDAQPSEETARILNQLAMLRDDQTASDPSGRLFLEQAIDLLRTKLVRHRPALGVLDAAAPRRGLATWQVKRVTSYMRDRLEQEIGLDELAALVSLSRCHFCTAFRMATGQTPYEWLTHERIARAKALLADPTLRIIDIALAVGYATPSAFAAVFRKLMGQTPREFRRRL